MKFVLLLVALVASDSAQNLPNFTGYVVTAQWDGRTFPTVQWALDVTRQDTEYRFQQEFKFQNLIPTTPGNALYDTLTAFEPTSRVYWTTVARNDGTGSLWGTQIANDVNSSKVFSAQVNYQFPDVRTSILMGLVTYSANHTAVALTVYDDGTVLQVDPTSGQTTKFASLLNNASRTVSTAITMDQKNANLYYITAAIEGKPDRDVCTFGIASMTSTCVPLAPLKFNNQMVIAPFQMLWLPNLSQLLVFWTGTFDQLIFTDPASGATAFYLDNLMEDNLIAFNQDDFLETDDTWQQVCMDDVNDKIYFQCSQYPSSSSSFYETSMCQIPIPKAIKAGDYVNIAIQPMTYGYAGFQYVQVIQ